MDKATSSGHTKGDWEVREYQSDITINAPGFREVAICRRIFTGGDPLENRAEQVANARLIASAPKLLAVVKAAAVVCNATKPDKRHAEDALRAALAALGADVLESNPKADPAAVVGGSASSELMDSEQSTGGTTNA